MLGLEGQLGLKVSWAKTKLMHVVAEGPDPPSLKIDGNAVEFADSFVYLGSTVTNNGDLKPKIKRRCALSSNVMQALRKPLWNLQIVESAHRQCCSPVCAAVRRGDLAAHWNPLLQA